MSDVDIDRLIKQSKGYLDSIRADMDPQVTTLVHRYICVLLSANIDQCIQLIFAEFARARGSDEIHRFVSRTYRRGTNYNADKIVQELNSFNPKWGETFKDETERTDLKEKLDALYGLRNSISHGGQMSVSRPTLDGYFDAHQKIIRLIRSIVLGRA